MVNTERMQGIQIDPILRTARVETGVRWRSVIAAAEPHGLAPLSGSTGDVGVVGYTLSGGLGWLLRKYGAAVDSVLSAEVVTADGQLRHVSPQHNTDLCWALCGGGGNFDILIALEFRLYPVSSVYGGALFFPIESAAEVLHAYSAWTATVPETMTSAVVLLRVLPLPMGPCLISQARRPSSRLWWLRFATMVER
jgi:FAD/FMN-containing dehydrogenase